MEFLKYLESIRTPFLDVMFGLITRMGEETVAIIMLCAIFWCLSKKTAYIMGTAYFLSGLTVQGMKISFRIERPWVIDQTFQPVQSAVGHATGYSFPSGHTQSAAAVLGSLAALIKQIPVKIILFFLAVLTAFSRMYLGVHTPIDVTVSFFISLLFVFLAVKILTGSTVDKKRELIIAVFITLYAVAVMVIAAVLFSGGKIEEKYLSDCLKAAGAAAGFAAGMYIERVYIQFSVNAKNILWQVIKFLTGIAGVLAVKEGLKLIIGTGLAADTIRYFLMLMWMTVFFPLVIKRFFTAENKRSGK